MNLKLFYSPPKWLAFEAPEYIDDMYHVENRLNEKAYAEAKANALEVENPILIRQVLFEDIEPTEIANKKETYTWKGSAVIKDGKYILSI